MGFDQNAQGLYRKGGELLTVIIGFVAEAAVPAVATYKGGLDGQFGPATEEAVRAYQDARTKAGANIGGVDGIVGTKTWGDLLGVAI